MSEPPATDLELPEPAAPGEPFLLLETAGRWVGVPLSQVLEVVSPRPCTRLPGGPDAVLGLVNLRSRVVTVVDLGASMGLVPEPRATGRIAVVEHRGKRVGLAVDDASRILKVDPAILEPPAAGEPLPFSALAEVEGRRLAILDTELLLGPVLA